MKKVMLVCNAGVSTGMLAKRVEQASLGTLEVRAYGEAEYLDYIEGYNLILVGPQIRHLIPDIQANVNIPVKSISPMDYGIMNGKAVYEEILKILG